MRLVRAGGHIMRASLPDRAGPGLLRRHTRPAAAAQGRHKFKSLIQRAGKPMLLHTIVERGAVVSVVVTVILTSKVDGTEVLHEGRGRPRGRCDVHPLGCRAGGRQRRGASRRGPWASTPKVVCWGSSCWTSAHAPPTRAKWPSSGYGVLPLDLPSFDMPTVTRHNDAR